MAEDLTREELRRYIDSLEDYSSASFLILQNVAALVNSVNGSVTEEQARDLVIRLFEKRQYLGSGRVVLDALASRLGLYPYVDPAGLPVEDQIAVEAHRPIDFPNEAVVFHRIQAHVYRLLLEDNNVILSAPMSFGKSLIIDAMAATGRYKNLVIVVPTLALMDETRRRLARFRNTYKLITHASQEVATQNIFILTQERVIDFPALPEIDFFVIDEFYKLDIHQDRDRAALLNRAFYLLWKGGGQFYLLGPSVRALSDRLPATFQYTFIQTDFNTVAFDVVRVPEGDDREHLIEVARGVSEPTLVYCRSPRQTRDVAEWLIEGRVGPETPELAPAIGWIGDTYHPQWLVGRALARGIGIHHGRLPRSLAQFMVRAFNDGRLRFLICTSTLIEGVNTAAKNVIIFDNKIARQKYDYFTFNNIRGRSGRMFRHFVGRVYLFHDPPPEELPFVDFPILTQSDEAPTGLLLELPAEDLSAHSRERLTPLLEQDVLPLEDLRANAGIDPERQLALAREIEANLGHYESLLTWRGIPTYDQLDATTALIWEFLAPDIRAGAYSARQLTFKINRLRDAPFAKAMIDADLASPYGSSTPDDVVEDALDFLRQWPGHHFPRLLGAVDRIQRRIFERRGIRPGDYSLFIAQVESRFLPGPLIALDEYGVPNEVAFKLRHELRPDEGLDQVLEALEGLDPERAPLTLFEKELVIDAQSGLRGDEPAAAL